MATKQQNHYENIIVGLGAAGLYCTCRLIKTAGADFDMPRNILVLEKTKRPGTKLLMAGSGQCNVTHGGSIKDFIKCYGENGKSIRSVLQRHNNLELQQFLESAGVPLWEREDGKVFPKSMSGKDVLAALMKIIQNSHAEIKYSEEVIGITPVTDGGKARFQVKTTGSTYTCTNLVIATGGCSYPSTGSDGKMLQVLSKDLNIRIEEVRPALTPVYVENYPYQELTGISFDDIEITIINKDSKIKSRGDLLFTKKNISGPVILNNSRYMKPGALLKINYLHRAVGGGAADGPEIIARFKKGFAGNGKSPQTYICEEFELPKRFAKNLCDRLAISEKKVSQLSPAEIKALALSLTEDTFTINSLAGFKEAMATKGGVALDQITLKTMESKDIAGLYFIGEAVDIDGDTGGYNLQFAYSSAYAAADSIVASMKNI